MYSRILNLENDYNDSIFVWGARQVGKTTLLKQQYPDARYYDLLTAGEFERFFRNPDLLAEELDSFSEGDIVIIDEIQKVPQLLDVVQYLIVSKGIRFILSGSSPRKLKRNGANLLGGRALRKVLHPLVSAEIDDFDLVKAVNNGMIPRHYMVNNPWERLRAYVGVYLEEEIRDESISRRLKSFTRFLESAAFTNGEMVVYKNIAQDCGIDHRTVKDYFTILSDSMIGYLIHGFAGTKKRKSIFAPKFYFFDVGIANYLKSERNLIPGSDSFGHAFEHLILQEVIAWLDYSSSTDELTYWRTNTGYEVDIIIGNGKIAIEIKSCAEAKTRHIKGLKAFKEEFPEVRMIIVTFDKYQRIMNDVEVFPAEMFLKALWDGKITNP